VKEEEEKLSIELPSKKFRVDAKEFSKELAKAPEFSFKIN
jgi:hypothetical protein